MGRNSHKGRTNKADIVQSKTCMVSAFFRIYTIANQNIGTGSFEKEGLASFFSFKAIVQNIFDTAKP